MVSDAVLLRQVRDGDDDAFGELYQRHAGVARNAARSLLSSSPEAEDVVSEAFTRILSILQRGGGPEEAFRPYLLTCVRHACYDRTQGIARSTPTDPSDLTDLAHARQRGELDPHEGSSDSELLARAFASLPERWQLVLWSTEVDGRRPHDLAKELGLAPGAVASLAFRAREGLTEAFLAAHLQRPSAPACAAVRPRLAAFVRDNVPGREEASIQDHLDHCHECQALVGELRDLNRPLRGLLVPAVVGISAGSYAAATSGGALLPRLLELLQARPLLSGAATAGVAVVATATFSGVVALRPADAPVGTVASSIVVANGSSASAAGAGPSSGPAPASTSGSGGPGGATVPVTVPAVSVPAGSLPPAAVPSVGGTPVTVPPVTVPPVTVPPVTVPSVTVPPVTVTITLPPITPPTLPPITLPPITVPPIALPLELPPVTVPPVTVPPVTVPPLTVPAVTLPLLTGTAAPR